MFNLPQQFIRFEVCAAVWLRPWLLWDVTQHTFSPVYRRLTTHSRVVQSMKMADT